MKLRYFVITSELAGKEPIDKVCFRYENCNFEAIGDNDTIEGSIYFNGSIICSISDAIEYSSSATREKMGEIKGAEYVYEIYYSSSFANDSDEIVTRIASTIAESGAGIAIDPVNEEIFYANGLLDYVLNPNKHATIDSKVVNKKIREYIRPFLKEKGFDKFTTRNYWRYTDTTIEVINFQSFNSHLAYGLECTTFSFAINIGIFFYHIPSLTTIRKRNNLLAPQEYDCHFRRSLSKNIQQRKAKRADIWYVDPAGSNLDSLMVDAREVLLKTGLTWFAKFRDLKNVQRELLKDESSWDQSGLIGPEGSPFKSYLLGFTALKVGDTTLARKALNDALQSGCFDNEMISARIASIS